MFFEEIAFLNILGKRWMPYLLPFLIPVLKKQFPQLKIFLVEEKTDALIHHLKQGKLDAILLSLPIKEDEFIVSSVFKEEFLLAVPKNHLWAKKNSINSQDIKKQQLLLIEEGHCLREQALEFCAKPNIENSQTITATSLETLRHMVAAGNGITLIPKLACTKHVYLPFKQPKPQRTIGLIYRATSTKKNLLRDITKILKQRFKA